MKNPPTAEELAWWDVCQSLRPDRTFASFRIAYAGYMKLKRDHARGVCECDPSCYPDEPTETP